MTSILELVRDFVKYDGAKEFFDALKEEFPEVYDELISEGHHRVMSLGKKEVPALLKSYGT